MQQQRKRIWLRPRVTSAEKNQNTETTQNAKKTIRNDDDFFRENDTNTGTLNTPTNTGTLNTPTNNESETLRLFRRSPSSSYTPRYPQLQKQSTIQQQNQSTSCSSEYDTSSTDDDDGDGKGENNSPKVQYSQPHFSQVDYLREYGYGWNPETDPPGPDGRPVIPEQWKEEYAIMNDPVQGPRQILEAVIAQEDTPNRLFPDQFHDLMVIRDPPADVRPDSFYLFEFQAPFLAVSLKSQKKRLEKMRKNKIKYRNQLVQMRDDLKKIKQLQLSEQMQKIIREMMDLGFLE